MEVIEWAVKPEQCLVLAGGAAGGHDIGERDVEEVAVSISICLCHAATIQGRIAADIERGQKADDHRPPPPPPPYLARPDHPEALRWRTHSSPAGAASDTLTAENRHAAPVRCSGWFGGDSFANAEKPRIMRRCFPTRPTFQMLQKRRPRQDQNLGVPVR